ncbi:unnamed protein product [Notodromas monacha]|uniref:Uncharacterized protein n=1 Tax=Notodromas monacha TaxID=399045 RepID=A0A7R9GH50_9CRUS|nr:unnamed protein product [Notodromas monacha]CAG0922520.1 unnamed protein product [Notodromas monacha]
MESGACCQQHQELLPDPNKLAYLTDTVAKKYLQGSYWSENEERHDIVTDYARINVYFDTLDQIEVHEKPKYTLSTIMSDLGGAAGIYLGICGITLFEIAAFLVNFVKVIVTSKWRKSVEVKVANPGVKWDHPTLSTIT